MLVYRSPWFPLEGYQACKVKFSDGSEKTILAHREVMETHLGRYLRSDEIIHHKDKNKTNNSLSNLEVMTKSEHSRLHALEAGTEVFEFTCQECGNHSIKLARNVRGNHKKGKVGPFCSRSCAGTYSQRENPRTTNSSKGPEVWNIPCTNCKVNIEILARRVREKRKRGMDNLFCSQKCSTKFKRTW